MLASERRTSPGGSGRADGSAAYTDPVTGVTLEHREELDAAALTEEVEEGGAEVVVHGEDRCRDAEGVLSVDGTNGPVRTLGVSVGRGWFSHRRAQLPHGEERVHWKG